MLVDDKKRKNMEDEDIDKFVRALVDHLENTELEDEKCKEMNFVNYPRTSRKCKRDNGP